MKNLLLLYVLTTVVFIRSAFAMSVTIYTSPDVCGYGNGEANAYVSGGVQPYTYEWSNGGTGSAVTNITGGTFLTLWVFDSANDSATSWATVPSQATLNASPMSWAGMNPCYGECNGHAHLIEDWLGGVAPYSAFYDGYPMDVYNNPTPGFMASNVCWNATGEVYVVDVNGCSVTWYEPPYYVTPQPVINSVSVNAACNGNNGSATVSDNSNTLNFMYYYNYYDSTMNLITGNTTSNYLGALGPGTYTVELVTITNHPDPYSYNWITETCYTVSQQFFVPDISPNCENVSGIVYHDDDLDCTHDGSEFTLDDVILTFTPGPYYAVTGGGGGYAINLPEGSYTISQSAPYTVYPVCPPASQVLDVLNGGQIIDYNFADTTQSALDLASFLSSTSARPGFDFTYHISARDFSYYSGGECTITFDYDSSLTFVSTDVIPASQTAGQITWTTNSIDFNTLFGADVTLHVPSFIPIGTPLLASCDITSLLSENNLSNNTNTISQLTVGSFDPNMKIVTGVGAYSGPQITASEDLSYTIYFQNTGTDTALNVMVTDTLSSYLDLSSVYVTHATHDYHLYLSDPGILKFSFADILLPDSNVNEPASHGYVNFRIRQMNGNAIGTVINNRAAIVFDFNAPVMTNDAWVYICSFDTTVNSVSICEGDSVFAGNEWQTQSGTYFDYYTNPNSCDSAVFTILSVNSIDATVNQDQNVLTAVLANASYQWYNCDLSLPISGATDQSYTAMQNGNYSVLITSNGCSMMSDCLEVIGTGAELTPNNWYTIHPNPAGDKLFIEFSDSRSVNQLVIQNTLGKIVYIEKLRSDERVLKEVDVNSFPAGIYLLTISGDGNRVEKVFVKK
ncbi:MAG TPA: T9SS type A sorting domain-containing protein [Chitinophagales bacterium]|nr:T9SS type A sorting domain-containing protein [Chitinophagales bacterium]